MIKIIKHIGLHILEKDLKPFYEDIIQFELLRSLILSENDCSKIFNIKENVNVLFGKCNDFELELFVSKTPQTASFSHICLATDTPSILAQKAIEKGYKVHLRQNNTGGTYFITDSNKNVFEIKKIN